MSDAERARRYRARKGASTRRGPAPAECGTAAAFRRHKRLGEALDHECDTTGRALEAERQAELHQARVARRRDG